VIDELALYSQVALSSVMVSSVASSMIFDSSLQGMWSLFNQYQLILLLPFLNTYLYPEFEYFINNFDTFRMEFSVVNIKSYSFMDDVETSFERDQTDSVYVKNGYESGSFIINQSGMILVILALS